MPQKPNKKDMKRIIAITSLLILTMALSAQGVYTKEVKDRKLVKTATRWSKKGAWRNGFTASPHHSVNLTEFYCQYEKNREQWDAMFQWLAKTDLLTIPKGKYPIEGTSLTVSVEDSKNQPLEKRKSESHYKHIDFQYVVKGKERFGILDHTTSSPNTEYRPDVIHYAYDKEKTIFYDSTPDTFFLFFPDDWHIAKVATEEEDQNIRVIVVKLDYK